MPDREVLGKIVLTQEQIAEWKRLTGQDTKHLEVKILGNPSAEPGKRGAIIAHASGGAADW